MKIEHPFPLSSLAIILRREGCFGTCPIYSIYIKGTGEVLFTGERFVEKVGEYVNTISREKVLQIYRFAQKIEFFEMKGEYKRGDSFELDENGMVQSYTTVITCIGSHSVEINIDGKSKKVSFNNEFAPKTVLRLASLIDRSCDSKKWVGKL